MAPMFNQCLLAILTIFILCTFYLHAVQSLKLQDFEKLPIPANGPESLAFDSNGVGPYTGISDGRIVKYLGPETGFVDFATTSANRTKELCDGNTDSNLEPTCGRTMGLEFNHKTGELYVLDARYGPMVVGPNGGLATHLAPGQSDLEGVPHDLPDGLDVDQTTGNVYFTYAGSVFLTGNMTLILDGGDTGGRLLKYDPKTKKVTLALGGLSGPFGNAVSEDGKYVLITEYITRTIRKFWLKGPNANTSEVIVTLPGHPDNIKRTNCGNFWIAQTILNLNSTPSSIPLGQKINAHGKILETLQLDSEYPDESVSEVHEHGGSLYIGTGSTDFVGLFRGYYSNRRRSSAY